MKAHLLKIARRLGVDVRRWPPEGSLDRDLRRLLAVRAITAVVDVGANVGQFGQRMRANGFRGHLVSVEPIPAMAVCLRRAADGDACWDVEELALGAVSGFADLTVYDNDQLSSLRDLSDNAKASWGAGAARRVQVRLESLEYVLEKYSMRPSQTFVKLDTQGYDLDVLRGSELAVRALAGLQVEMPVSSEYEGSATMGDLLESILSWGFRPLGFHPVQRDPADGITPIEFDGLFVSGPSGQTVRAEFDR